MDEPLPHPSSPAPAAHDRGGDAPAATDPGDTADATADGFDPAVVSRPRTGTVLGLLVTAALVLSYFVAYPLTNALRAAEVLAPPAAAGYDARAGVLAVTFVSLLGGCGVIAGATRLLGRRQMRRLDEMAEPEDTVSGPQRP